MKTRILSLLFLLFLLWRAGSAFWDLGSEIGSFPFGDLPLVFSLSEEQRIERGLGFLERRLGIPKGSEFELYEEIRSETPGDGEIFFVNRAQKNGVFVFSHLRILLYPRSFWILGGLNPGWQEQARRLGGRCFILEFGEPDFSDLSEWCDLLAGSPTHRLWRFRRKGR